MMKMYLCPEHERKLREAYWMSECSGSGECGVIGCAAAGCTRRPATHTPATICT